MRLLIRLIMYIFCVDNHLCIIYWGCGLSMIWALFMGIYGNWGDCECVVCNPVHTHTHTHTVILFLKYYCFSLEEEKVTPRFHAKLAYFYSIFTTYTLLKITQISNQYISASSISSKRLLIKFLFSYLFLCLHHWWRLRCLRDTLMGIFQIWHKHSLWINDELSRI